MKSLLAIESATEQCSIAVQHGAQILTRRVLGAPNHSVSILPFIDELLNEAGMALHDLDAIVVGNGPGSFTGVRLAISVAQGLCFGANLPCLPVSSLATLAYGARSEAQGRSYILPALDARMGEVYAALYQLEDGRLTCLIAPTLLKPPQLATFAETLDIKADIRIGSGWDLYVKRENGTPVYPEAVDLLALFAHAEAQTINVMDLHPLYCRNAVAHKA